MAQQRDIPSILEVNEENKQQQIPLPQTSSHILATAIRTDNTASSATVIICSSRAQDNQPTEHSESSNKTIPDSGAFLNHGDERCNDRNSITLHNTPILPQQLFSQINQMQALSHYETTGMHENISTTVVLPPALLLPNQSFIHTHAARHDNDSEMEQHSIGDENIDRIRKDLAQLGFKLQENARQQVRLVGEAEWPDITDIVETV